MKILLAAILLATTALAAQSEPRTRQVRFMCASFEELQMTLDKYGEKMVIATQAPNERTVNILYMNSETQTSSWILHDLQTNEYCMVGVGNAIYIPDESPIKQGNEIGTKVNYK
jgi:hypothetical protein